jgi:hypothetical protein
MELVKQIPISEYCDRHRLDLPARLAVFGQVSSAVQHAHQKGISDRDSLDHASLPPFPSLKQNKEIWKPLAY